MGFQLFFIIVFLLIASIIGVFACFTRKTPLDDRNRRIIRSVTVLQAVHIALFFSDALGKMGFDLYMAFGVYALISLVCISFSVWMVLPFSGCKDAIKYLLFFLSLIQIFTVIFLYLLPEAGIPAPIPLL